jgi:hypothetical protein
MRRTLSALAACAILLFSVLAAPAQAANTRFTDPAGDGSRGERLDITRGTLSNRDRAIVVATSYVRAARGSLIVFLKGRGAPVIRVVSEHRPSGVDRNYLLDRRSRKLACTGLRVTWDETADTSLVRMPSRCYNGGDYGAVRTFILTEIGADADIAPSNAVNDGKWSAWTARG